MIIICPVCPVCGRANILIIIISRVVCHCSSECSCMSLQFCMHMSLNAHACKCRTGVTCMNIQNCSDMHVHGELQWYTCAFRTCTCMSLQFCIYMHVTECACMSLYAHACICRTGACTCSECTCMSLQFFMYMHATAVLNVHSCHYSSSEWWWIRIQWHSCTCRNGVACMYMQNWSDMYVHAELE